MHSNPTPHPAARISLNHIHALADRRFRDNHGQFWIEGIRHFVQACDAKLHFDSVLLSPILLKSDLADMLARRLRVSGVPCLRVTPEAFRAVSKTERASGIGAVVRQPWRRLNDLDPSAGVGLLVAEEIRSPGNLGTILRTAEATGISGLIFVGCRCDPFDPTVVRASMGAISHLPLVRTTHQALAPWLHAKQINLIGLTPHAKELWTDLPASPRLAIALGEERAGLSAALSAMCHANVQLPMTGKADSLNVGVAAGVMMYELVRRGMSAAGSPHVAAQ